MTALAGLFSALALLAPSPSAATLVAAGDIASCDSTGDEQTAALVEHIPGTVATLGDAVYEHGTAEEFAECYSWARFRARTRAALGNHEYGTGNADAAAAYFRIPRRGYYSYRLGAWHVIVLNSNCSRTGGCEHGSPQERWLRDVLARSSARCTLAYWHHPRWSSGLHGSDATVAPLWKALAEARADVVLSGHDHHYERLRPVGGIRSFVVGSGGRGHYPVLWRHPHSVTVDDHTYGVLRLTLRPRAYDWSFVAVAGGRYEDRGSARCR